MRSVLIVAPYFIPRRRVGALRPYKFAVQLQKMGWNVSVLTIGTPEGEFTPREAEALKNVNIIPVNPPFDRTSGKKSDQKNNHAGSSIFQKAGKWIDKHTPVDTWMYLFLIRYFQIMKRVKQASPDLVWATGDPWSGLWLGNKIARKCSVPFVADFRDPWTLTSMNLRERSGFSGRMDQIIEKRVIENADKIIFTSKAAENKYQNHYSISGEKSATIYNSFDSTLFQPESNTDWNKTLDSSKLNVLFYGRFRRLSPAEPIINVLNKIKDKKPKIINDIRVHSFGKTDPNEYDLIKASGLTDQFTEHEQVLPEKTFSVLNSADLLLVSTQQQRDNIVPAKLWDYLSVERPVLSITPNTEIGDILQQSGAGIHFQPDQIDEIADFLIEAVQNKQEDKPVIKMKKTKQPERSSFNSESTAKELAGIFDELMNNE